MKSRGGYAQGSAHLACDLCFSSGRSQFLCSSFPAGASKAAVQCSSCHKPVCSCVCACMYVRARLSVRRRVHVCLFVCVRVCDVPVCLRAHACVSL